MRRRPPTTGLLSRIATTSGMLVAGGLLAYGAMSYAGVFDEKESREGMIAVPRSIVSMNALSEVRREDIYDRSKGDDSYFWMSKARVEAHPEWIIKASDIIGRVMARNKEPDKVFTEADFLPEGSRTGLSAGIPEGKQGFFVEAETIPGLELLKAGDTFDLLASLPEEAKEKQDAEFGLLAGGIKVRGGKPVPLNGVRVLVKTGTMVAITRGQEMTTQGSMASAGTRVAFQETRNRSHHHRDRPGRSCRVDSGHRCRNAGALRRRFRPDRLRETNRFAGRTACRNDSVPRVGNANPGVHSHHCRSPGRPGHR